MSSAHLGKGTYGTVTKVGDTAVKEFHKCSHLVQEYAAGMYLQDCPYTVDVLGADFRKPSMTMRLYDGSLKDWLNSGKRSAKQKLFMIREILKGLIWLHDLGLVHGDIKPGNIVANWDPSSGNLTRVVLADLGFVAPEKYAKAERTAPIYRETEVERDFRHDIYSLGVICLEAFGKFRVKRQYTARILINTVKMRVRDAKLKDLIIWMLEDDREERPTARALLYHMFGQKVALRKHPGVAVNSDSSSVVPHPSELENLFRRYGEGVPGLYAEKAPRIFRTRNGYYLCKNYIEAHHVSMNKHMAYACTVLMILSSLFGESGYAVEDAAYTANCSTDEIYRILEELLSDREVLTHLFLNKSSCI